MKNEENSEFLEIPFEFLFAITNDIIQRAINANIDIKVLNNLTVRIPKNCDNEKRFYEVGV